MPCGLGADDMHCAREGLATGSRWCTVHLAARSVRAQDVASGAQVPHRRALYDSPMDAMKGDLPATRSVGDAIAGRERPCSSEIQRRGADGAGKRRWELSRVVEGGRTVGWRSSR